MIEQTKVDAVAEYLRNEFHGFEVSDVYHELGERDQMFIERNFRKFQIFNYPKTYVVKLERLFLDDTRDVRKALDDIELGKIMRVNEGRQILVTKGKGIVVL
jgi:hypothetical protein